MIPASYLFKTAYHDAFERVEVVPTAPIARPARAGHIDGLLSPIAAAVTWLRHSPARAMAHHGFAHD